MTRIRLLLLAFASFLFSSGVSHADDVALDLFQQRIMPIFQSPDPSSCVQCHLSSVDLKDYILPSHEQTFLSLRDQGLIDLQRPQDSKILKLIKMGDQDRDEMSKRIHAKMRNAEHEAFAAWITACCNDKTLAGLAPATTQTPAKPAKPDVVIRHTRKDRLLDSFVRNVWSQRMRCFPCHTPGEIDAEDPNHEKPKERYVDYVKTYGAKMNLFKASPIETMNSMISTSRRPNKKHLPLLNFRDPPNSLLVLKPTAKLPAKTEAGKMGDPSSVLPVSHVGGLKMHVDDHSYKAFISWIEDCGKTVGDEYETLADLPQDNWFPTEHILRVKETPESWTIGSVVQLFVYRWDAETDEWHDDAIAFTQGTITPRRFVNGSLFLLDPNSGTKNEDGEAMYRMQPGKVLIKAYVDTNNRIAKRPSLLLDEDDFQGQVETQASWGIGFPEAEIVDGNSFD